MYSTQLPPRPHQQRVMAAQACAARSQPGYARAAPSAAPAQPVYGFPPSAASQQQNQMPYQQQRPQPFAPQWVNGLSRVVTQARAPQMLPAQQQVTHPRPPAAQVTQHAVRPPTVAPAQQTTLEQRYQQNKRFLDNYWGLYSQLWQRLCEVLQPAVAEMYFEKQKQRQATCVKPFVPPPRFAEAPKQRQEMFEAAYNAREYGLHWQAECAYLQNVSKHTIADNVTRNTAAVNQATELRQPQHFQENAVPEVSTAPVGPPAAPTRSTPPSEVITIDDDDDTATPASQDVGTPDTHVGAAAQTYALPASSAPASSPNNKRKRAEDEIVIDLEGTPSQEPPKDELPAAKRTKDDPDHWDWLGPSNMPPSFLNQAPAKFNKAYRKKVEGEDIETEKSFNTSYKAEVVHLSAEDRKALKQVNVRGTRQIENDYAEFLRKEKEEKDIREARKPTAEAESNEGKESTPVLEEGGGKDKSEGKAMEKQRKAAEREAKKQLAKDGGRRKKVLSKEQQKAQIRMKAKKEGLPKARNSVNKENEKQKSKPASSNESCLLPEQPVYDEPLEIIEDPKTTAEQEAEEESAALFAELEKDLEALVEEEGEQAPPAKSAVELEQERMFREAKMAHESLEETQDETEEEPERVSQVEDDEGEWSEEE